jgi:hypothetical protein
MGGRSERIVSEGLECAATAGLEAAQTDVFEGIIDWECSVQTFNINLRNHSLFSVDDCTRWYVYKTVFRRWRALEMLQMLEAVARLRFV